MRRFVLTALFTTAFATAALASVFVWQDPKGDFSISFPDEWHLQTVDGPDTHVRIAGPLAEDRASCKVQVTEDGRLKVYPKRLTDEAVAQTLDMRFWEVQAAEHDNVRISDFYVPASLGDKGDASAVRVAFTADDGKDKNAKMYGAMLASVYGGKLYVASCSSRHDMYPRYAPIFGEILDSIMLKSKYHIFPTGYYRNFLMDPKLILPRSKPGTVKEGSRAGNWFKVHKYHYNP
jgi:hypothetical protein